MSAHRLLHVAVLASIFFSVSARAAQREIVTLLGGASIEGDLIEYAEADHVTLRLDDGTERRFEWVDIASASAAPGSSVRRRVTRYSDAFDASTGLSSPLVAGAVVDWPEPDRSPPDKMLSRLSVGLLGTTGGPLGRGAIAAEWLPWYLGVIEPAFRVSFGPWGALGPTLSEHFTVEMALGSVLELGLGVGVAQSFRSGPTATDQAAAKHYLTFLDFDLSHVNVIIARTVTARVGLSMARALGVRNGECLEHVCGRMSSESGLYGMAALLWNFDTSPGER